MQIGPRETIDKYLPVIMFRHYITKISQINLFILSKMLFYSNWTIYEYLFLFSFVYTSSTLETVHKKVENA